MRQKTKATDGGDADDEFVKLTEQTVKTEEALADALDEDTDEDIALERSARVLEVLQETGATLLKLQSSWHGNKFIGDWQELWLAHIDFKTDKAVHMNEVIDAGYPMRMVGKLREERGRSSPNERALERYEEAAFKNWENGKTETNSWGDPNHLYTTDEYCPKAVIDTAISVPARDDHYVFTPDGVNRGGFDDADLVVRKTVMHEYKSNGVHQREEKFAIAGDNYEAFVSANLKNVLPFMPVEDDDGEVIEQGTFHSYNGEYWVIRMDGLETFVDYSTDAGFTVGVHNDYTEYLNEI